MPWAIDQTRGKVKEQAIPCGTPCRRVNGYEMAWANAVLVFEKAKPAKRLARDTSVRSDKFRGSARSRGSVAIMVQAASTAKASETGLAFRFQIASKACDKASSALTRVTLSGSVKVRAGSTKATSDHKASV
jgi:hypothetical protein